MTEKIPTREIYGKVYASVKDLINDIRAFRQQNFKRLGIQADDSSNTMVLRLFGKQMVQYEKEGNRKYWQMEDAADKSFVSAIIYKESDSRVSLNVYDYRQWVASGGKVHPELIYWMTLDKNNIKNFSLQLELKRLKSNKIEK